MREPEGGNRVAEGKTEHPRSDQPIEEQERQAALRRDEHEIGGLPHQADEGQAQPGPGEAAKRASNMGRHFLGGRLHLVHPLLVTGQGKGDKHQRDVDHQRASPDEQRDRTRGNERKEEGDLPAGQGDISHRADDEPGAQKKEHDRLVHPAREVGGFDLSDAAGLQLPGRHRHDGERHTGRSLLDGILLVQGTRGLLGHGNSCVGLSTTIGHPHASDQVADLADYFVSHEHSP